jgi:hypothetical protein
MDGIVGVVVSEELLFCRFFCPLPHFTTLLISFATTERELVTLRILSGGSTMLSATFTSNA